MMNWASKGCFSIRELFISYLAIYNIKTSYKTPKATFLYNVWRFIIERRNHEDYWKKARKRLSASVSDVKKARIRCYLWKKRFIKNKKYDSWNEYLNTPGYHSWRGISFEIPYIINGLDKSTESKIMI